MAPFFWTTHTLLHRILHSLWYNATACKVVLGEQLPHTTAWSAFASIELIKIKQLVTLSFTKLFSSTHTTLSSFPCLGLHSCHASKKRKARLENKQTEGRHCCFQLCFILIRGIFQSTELRTKK